MTEYPIHPLCAMSPGMTAEQFAEFKEDIRVNGQREPVKVWCEQVIDGRHRIQALKELGVAPKTATVSLTEAELPAYVLSLNAMRNHLTGSQRGFYVAELTKGQTRGLNLRSANLQIGVPTVEQAAKTMRVSAGTVYKAKRVQQKASPEVAEAVRDGKLTLHAATRITNSVPKEDQAAKVAEITSKPIPRGRPVMPLSGGKAHAPPRRKEPVEDLVDRAVTNLDVATQALADYGERSAPSPDQRASWVTTLDRAAGIIRRFRAHLKEVAA